MAKTFGDGFQSRPFGRAPAAMRGRLDVDQCQSSPSK
jgi:hypothetical protein